MHVRFSLDVIVLGILNFATNPLFSCKVQNSKKKFWHLYGDLNLDEIKNAMHNLTVNCETNLMNLIRL